MGFSIPRSPRDDDGDVTGIDWAGVSDLRRRKELKLKRALAFLSRIIDEGES